MPPGKKSSLKITPRKNASWKIAPRKTAHQESYRAENYFPEKCPLGKLSPGNLPPPPPPPKQKKKKEN